MRVYNLFDRIIRSSTIQMIQNVFYFETAHTKLNVCALNVNESKE